MKRLLILVAIGAAACGGSGKGNPAGTQTASEMRTIDSVPPQPAAVQPPPMVTDESAPVKSATNMAGPDAPPPPTPQDEAVRAALPFTPAIGLDPVDGLKLSIRATTPMLEYKSRIFYFNSEENKRTFAANPEQYTHGVFALPK